METRLPFQQQKVCKLKITPPDHCKPMNIVYKWLETRLPFQQQKCV